ncbi:hypothetical protein C5167_003848 [Papaver somniferum]|uniref:Uncharacterized protein n=1 Tax=Papaver somniferum TaxID=3469 RepID=A0A4Y7L181_PAPSO|nr:hypothetical protein C5167_003848 [Papaver somniferum]
MKMTMWAELVNVISDAIISGSMNVPTVVLITGTNVKDHLGKISLGTTPPSRVFADLDVQQVSLDNATSFSSSRWFKNCLHVEQIELNKMQLGGPRTDLRFGVVGKIAMLVNSWDEVPAISYVSSTTAW